MPPPDSFWEPASSRAALRAAADRLWGAALARELRARKPPRRGPWPSKRGRQGAAHASLRPERLAEVRGRAKFVRREVAAGDMQPGPTRERMPAPIPPDPSASWLGSWSRPADRPSEIAFALACVLLVTA